ncbi:FG-GAP repeat domain-containing protein [Candidatus Uabimicrobium amorphum]|uniref:RNA-binding protein n=1 Tax=Uabimicrobium amorphum TaxID=2596890 RepID=A0A5S9IXG5_UABAM|nr:VCBS repeat-containing protein [Candidatus Uabimicrobium amorphum]BBM88315.1 RNA-binding protein [Candidatus Uabimicrobium amorphum]
MSRKFLFVFSALCVGFYLLFVAFLKYQKRYHNNKVLAQIQKNEEVLDTLSPVWRALEKDVNNLELPGHYSSSYFSKELVVYAITANTKKRQRTSLEKLDYTCSSVPQKLVPVWQEIFSQVQYFKYAETARVEIELVDESIYSIDLYMDALGKSHDNQFISVYAEFSIKVDVKNEEPLQVLITEWKNTKIDIRKSKQLLFSDDTDVVIQSPKAIIEANGSFQEEQVIKALQGEKVPSFFFGDGVDTGKVSICDIDKDGWDDVYITSKGRNVFLKNNNGVLEEISSQHGLNLKKSSCSLFVDVDNDGDEDAIIGRYLKKSLLLINDGGTFRIKKDVELPRFVTSISSADYNNDGLLDLYVSTYYVTKLAGTYDQSFSSEEIREYRSLLKKKKKGDSRNIARNMLLRNNGSGQFVLENSSVNVHTSGHQGCWSDFDQDNDVDLYIANDFGRDFLFRNDQENGFNDVSHLLGSIGSFSMGISWGDYNNDQKMDMFVSGMYSKAGSRLTKRLIPLGLDPQFLRMAQGNFLFTRHTNNNFQPQNMKGLWSWGGQFGDFDNDGYLDIYLVDGYYTAPKQFRRGGDT